MNTDGLKRYDMDLGFLENENVFDYICLRLYQDLIDNDIKLPAEFYNFMVIDRLRQVYRSEDLPKILKATKEKNTDFIINVLAAEVAKKDTVKKALLNLWESKNKSIALCFN